MTRTRTQSRNGGPKCRRKTRLRRQRWALCRLAYFQLQANERICSADIWSDVDVAERDRSAQKGSCKRWETFYPRSKARARSRRIRENKRSLIRSSDPTASTRWSLPEIGLQPTGFRLRRLHQGEQVVARESLRSRPGTRSRTKLAINDGVRFTHPDRVYWVDVGITKRDLAEYYRYVWDWMAPHLAGRPLALVRCPDGTKGECFFQKHLSAGLAEHTLRIVTDSKGRQVIAVDDLSGLLSLVQAGVLEVHVRGSTINRLDLCDRIVFDLDPGDRLSWSAVVAAARDMRERLNTLKLESFIKLSGGKGLHVVVPIVRTEWDRVKAFVQAFAQKMALDRPERYVAKVAKSIRRERIFVDYLRNSLDQTSIAAYSTRARPGAPVSTPIAWEELGRTIGGDQYTVRNLKKRLGRLKRDPWSDISRVQQTLPDSR